MKKQLVLVTLLVALMLLGIATAVVVATPPDHSNGKGPVVSCEADARVCPDGTLVYRVPPSCHFEKCPK